MGNLYKKMIKILRDSKSVEEVENKIEDLALSMYTGENSIRNLVMKIIPALKDSLFKSYQNYSVSYLGACANLINNIKYNERKYIVPPVIFNLHQGLELFFKSYKVLYHNLYGCKDERYRSLRTSTPKEMGVIGHDLDAFFDDEQMLFILELFGSKKSLLENIQEKYNQMKRATNFEVVAENARYPQKNQKFLPNDITYLENKSIDIIFNLVQEIIGIVVNLLFQQSNSKNLNEENVKKLLSEARRG